jgi:hypothetical protein
MPSKQMAFQMSEYEYVQTLAHIVTMYEQKDAKSTIVEWVEALEPDPKKRDRIKAVLVISTRCTQQKIDPMRVKKLICWRNEKGEPSLIEAEVDGRRLRGEAAW